MVNCFFCGKKIGWTTNYTDVKTMAHFGESIPSGMTDKDKICEDCVKEGKTNEGYRDPSEPVLPSSHQEESTSGFTSTVTTKSNSKITSMEELRTLTTIKHDDFKSKWDKNGVVQYKDDKIAILKRVVGQQVQFMVAASKLTEEGYRLMSIDEGITAQGSGFTGGASAYFYFQKMDYVR